MEAAVDDARRLRSAAPRHTFGFGRRGNATKEGRGGTPPAIDGAGEAPARLEPVSPPIAGEGKDAPAEEALLGGGTKKPRTPSRRGDRRGSDAEAEEEAVRRPATQPTTSPREAPAACEPHPSDEPKGGGTNRPTACVGEGDRKRRMASDDRRRPSREALSGAPSDDAGQHDSDGGHAKEKARRVTSSCDSRVVEEKLPQNACVTACQTWQVLVSVLVGFRPKPRDTSPPAGCAGVES